MKENTKIVITIYDKIISLIESQDEIKIKEAINIIKEKNYLVNDELLDMLRKYTLICLEENFLEPLILDKIGIHANLTKLPKSILGLSSSIKTMYLAENKFTTLPEELAEFRILENLNLNYNEISNFSCVIEKMPQLKALTLSYNKMTDIKGIGHLVNLEYLNLSYNQLSTLPEEISNLKNLEHLHIVENPLISTLPKEIGQLDKLRFLYLSCNNIKELPEEISNLKNLERIGLGENPISESELDKIQQWLPNCQLVF